MIDFIASIIYYLLGMWAGYQHNWWLVFIFILGLFLGKVPFKLGHITNNKQGEV